MYGHGDAAERLLTPPPRYPIPRLGRDPVQAADLIAPPSVVVGGSKHTIVHEPTLTERSRRDGRMPICLRGPF